MHTEIAFLDWDFGACLDYNVKYLVGTFFH